MVLIETVYGHSAPVVLAGGCWVIVDNDASIRFAYLAFKGELFLPEFSLKTICLLRSQFSCYARSLTKAVPKPRRMTSVRSSASL